MRPEFSDPQPAQTIAVLRVACLSNARLTTDPIACWQVPIEACFDGAHSQTCGQSGRFWACAIHFRFQVVYKGISTEGGNGRIHCPLRLQRTCNYMKPKDRGWRRERDSVCNLPDSKLPWMPGMPALPWGLAPFCPLRRPLGTVSGAISRGSGPLL